jgi:hypothetical protein
VWSSPTADLPVATNLPVNLAVQGRKLGIAGAVCL